MNSTPKKLNLFWKILNLIRNGSNSICKSLNSECICQLNQIWKKFKSNSKKTKLQNSQIRKRKNHPHHSHIKKPHFHHRPISAKASTPPDKKPSPFNPFGIELGWPSSRLIVAFRRSHHGPLNGRRRIKVDRNHASHVNYNKQYKRYAALVNTTWSTATHTCTRACVCVCVCGVQLFIWNGHRIVYTQHLLISETWEQQSAVETRHCSFSDVNFFLLYMFFLLVIFFLINVRIFEVV